MGDFKEPRAHSSLDVDEWSRVDLHQILGSGCFFLFRSLPLNLDFGVWLPPLKRTYDMVGDYCIIFTHLSHFLSFFKSTGGRR